MGRPRVAAGPGEFPGDRTDGAAERTVGRQITSWADRPDTQPLSDRRTPPSHMPFVIAPLSARGADRGTISKRLGNPSQWTQQGKEVKQRVRRQPRCVRRRMSARTRGEKKRFNRYPPADRTAGLSKDRTTRTSSSLPT